MQISLCLGIEVDGKDVPAFLAEGSADGPGAGEELEKERHYLLWVLQIRNTLIP